MVSDTGFRYLIPVLLLLSPAFAAEEPLTLAECYRLALTQSEAIALREEEIAQAQARFAQARSGILPKVSFSSSDKRQDGTGGSAFTLKEVPERKFVMSQPLFSGFKEFAAMKGYQAEQREFAYQKARAKQLLFQDVSEAFYLVLKERKTLSALAAIREILINRIAELKEREALGRSRRAEVFSAQGQLFRLEADLQVVESQEAVARQLLEFLTGFETVGPLIEADPLLSLLDEETRLPSVALRPDLQAAEERLDKSYQEERIARAGRWPSVSLESNYFVERVGASKEVDWDAALKVEVPLFEGGLTGGQVKEKEAQTRQAAIELSQSQRLASHEVKEVLLQLQAARLQTSAHLKAVKALEESYRLQEEEYRLNLVNHLEVLESLRELEESRLRLIEAEYGLKQLYWKFKVATGEVPEMTG